MKHLKWTALVLGLSLFAFSCTQTAYVTGGKSYEDDEVYYQPGETFISDLPVAEVTQTSGEEDYYESPEQDEYYQGEQNADVINNYYGNDGFNNNWGTGINTNLMSPFGSNWTWSPIWGWRLSYNWGWAGYGGWGFNSWNNPWYYDPWFTGCYGGLWDPYWGSPFYNPWGYGWGYNNFGAGYCGSPYAGNIWDDGAVGGGNGTYYGHHTGVSTGSNVNSNYTGGALYSDRITKPKKPIQANPSDGGIVAGTDGVVRGGAEKPMTIEKEPARTTFSPVNRPVDFNTNDTESASDGKDGRINFPDISNKPYVSTRPASNGGSSKGNSDEYYTPSHNNTKRPTAKGNDRNSGVNQNPERQKPSSSGSNSGGSKVEKKSSDHRESGSSKSDSSPSRNSSKPSYSPSPSSGGSGGGSRPSGGGGGGGRSSSSSSSSGKKR